LINSNSNRLNFNNASNNAEYGINLNNSSTNNILIGNIADSNGIKNIHVADSVNTTVNNGLPQENDSAQKLLFKSFILSVITIITAALIAGRRVREY
jgi:parallel beta-helix repeat protein